MARAVVRQSCLCSSTHSNVRQPRLPGANQRNPFQPILYEDSFAGKPLSALKLRSFVVAGSGDKKVVPATLRTSGQGLVDKVSVVNSEEPVRPTEQRPVGGLDDHVPGEDVQTCVVCQRTKLLCDFKRRRGASVTHQDVCRACLAKALAVRLGGNLHHLEIDVNEAWEKAKVCNKCKVRKELRDFSHNKNAKDLVNARCRSCLSTEKTPRKYFTPQVESKRCIQCDKIKLASEFYINHNVTSGLDGRCKRCSAEYYVERRAKLRVGTYLQRTDKMCNTCGHVKPCSDFKTDLGTFDQLNSKCKMCEKAAQKA